MRVLRLIAHIVAAAALLGGASSALAQGAATSGSDITAKVDVCKTDRRKTERSECVKDVYVQAKLWPQLEASSGCFIKNSKLLDIEQCEHNRRAFSPPDPQVTPSARGSSTGTLLTPKASLIVPSGGDATLAADGREPVPQPPKTPSAGDGFLAWIVVALLLLIGAGGMFLLLRKHKADVKTIKEEFASENKGLDDKCEALAREMKQLKAAFSASQPSLEQRISDLESERRRQSTASSAPAATRSPQASHSQPASGGSPSLTLEAFQGALTLAFRALVDRNSPLPSGREYDRLLAAIDDKQVKAFVEARGLSRCRFLDGNGVANSLNPTLFAIQIDATEWFIFPMPFAERTAMYRQWFDGFDESKSMIALFPAKGRDVGGAIKQTLKGQLA